MLEPSRIVHDQAIVFVKEIGSDWTKPLAAQFSFGWLHLFDQLIFGSSDCVHSYCKKVQTDIRV